MVWGRLGGVIVQGFWCDGMVFWWSGFVVAVLVVVSWWDVAGVVVVSWWW